MAKKKAITKKKTSKKKAIVKKAGQPSKYKPEYCKTIVEVLSTGDTMVCAAATIGVSKQTLHEWAKVHPEFSDALDRGRALCEKWWVNAGKQGMFMGGQNNPFQATIWKFFMSARFDWREKTDVVEDSNVTVNMSYDPKQLKESK